MVIVVFLVYTLFVQEKWVYKTLTVVCGVACATAVLCLPCAVGVALVFEADIMYCIGKANGNY